MFDESSRQLLRGAPNLSGIDTSTIDELLTSAYIDLAAIRLETSEGTAENGEELLRKIKRLASTFEAYISHELHPKQTQATAFVAATAHQIFSQTIVQDKDQPTLLTSNSVDSSIVSMLLFLIADRAADAAEVASKIRAKGEPSGVRRSLLISLREFAKGDLTKIIERDLQEIWIEDRDSREVATDLMFLECAQVVQELAREALGGLVSVEEIQSRLLNVVELSKAQSINPLEEFGSRAFDQYAGPHHLATLLNRLIPNVRSSMLVRTPLPAGCSDATWSQWLLPQAKSRPFLWTNHIRAIETGYLDRGHSMVMTTPTGSGKTTLSVLKIAATLCAGKSVVYLAPTHALVDQIEFDLTDEVGGIEPKSVEELLIDDIGELLPPFSVMTPERCLALMGSAPELFKDVGLLVFDEFHLIGADDPKSSSQINSRAIDAMLALLNFMKLCKDADFLLLSAMVANGEQISSWLIEVTGKKVEVFDDPWKPTRQLRSCVVYDKNAVISAANNAQKLPTKTEQNSVPAQPLGLFSLIAGWHPDKPEKLDIRALSEHKPALKRNANNVFTSNRNSVAARIAADYAKLGKKVIVFCTDAVACTSISNKINGFLDQTDIDFDDQQESLRVSIIKDVGSAEAAYEPKNKRASVHHGDLIAAERRLTETTFRKRRNFDSPNRGLEVISATSTIAQGLNLPCDVVILAGTDRSAQDDPGGNPRKDLLPHEILNAMGRAGRAAYSATGLSIVIPAKPIPVDPSGLKFGPSQFPLDTIFSDKDACHDIIDPIGLLLDSIETSANEGSKIQAMIRRMSTISPDGKSGFDHIAKNSLGYFIRKSDQAADADGWLTSRRAALTNAVAELQDETVLSWQQELAVRNGVPPQIISKFTNGFDTAPTDKTNTSDWINWLLDLAVSNHKELTLFIRETSLESVFGRAYKNQIDKDASTYLILDALKTLVQMWCSGKTLVEIEEWILAFVRNNEGQVKSAAPKDRHAKRARRFAIRILPDIGFICSLLSQVGSSLELETAKSPSPIIELLQQMVKAGDFDRHQYCLRLESESNTRVGCFEEYSSLKEKFTVIPDADIETIRQEVSSVYIFQMFDIL